jgi:hypothetical protein
MCWRILGNHRVDKLSIAAIAEYHQELVSTPTLAITLKNSPEVDLVL